MDISSPDTHTYIYILIYIWFFLCIYLFIYLYTRNTHRLRHTHTHLYIVITLYCVVPLYGSAFLTSERAIKNGMIQCVFEDRGLRYGVWGSICMPIEPVKSSSKQPS